MAAIFQLSRRRTAGKAPTPSMTMSIKHTFEGHQNNIQSFVFLEDNVHIVSGSEDGTIGKWDCETGQLVGESWKGVAGIIALALSPDGKTIACGRKDGSVQRWDTNGQMKEDIWMGHSAWVRSLSWSPSGGHLASGSSDGTIVIRKVESGAVEVGPIKTHQRVWSVAYSPLGDRIASGGRNTICIWDGHTGKLLVGPINDLGFCVVWSSDGSKVYSASGFFARVFDSASGTLLHRFQHHDYVYSIALSPKHNLLACVGWGGTAQLWDTVSHQPFHVLFANNKARELFHVSFSPDGRYLAYGGDDKTITLWTVGDIAELLVPASSTILQGGTQQIALPKSQSSASLNVNLAHSAVNDEQDRNDPYGEFFAPSHSSLPSPNPSPRRRFRHVFSVFHLPINDSIRRKRFTRGAFQHRALSTPPSHPPENCEQPQPTLKGKSRAMDQDEERGNVNSSENVAPGTTECGNDKGKQRGDPIPDRKTSTPRNLSSPAELHSDENQALWKYLFRSRKKDSNKAPANVTRDSSPEAVDVYAVRYQQGYVAHHTDNDSYSDLSIHGPLFKCLDWMCFPRGHYEDEDT